MKTAHPFSQRITYDTGRIGTQTSFPGVTGNYLSTPAAASVDITGDIEVVVRVALTDWTPASTQALVVRDGSAAGAPAGTRSWTFRVGPANLFFLMSADGTAGPTQVGSTFIPIADGVMGWLRVTRVRATGLVSFYSAVDSPTEPAVWTARSTGTINAGVALPTVTAPLMLGQRLAAEPLNGRLSRVIVRSGIAGTTVFEFDERNIPDDTVTAFSASTGQTVTIVGDPLGVAITGMLPHQLAETHQEHTFAPTYRGPR